MSVLKNHQEDWVVDLGIEAIKSQLNTKETPFFAHWNSETRFTISLNFSIGTNKAFDVHTDSKSAIKAFGTLTPLLIIVPKSDSAPPSTMDYC